jgi:hypothetical protein
MTQDVSTDCEKVDSILMMDCQFLERYKSEGNREFIIRQLNEVVRTAPLGLPIQVVFVTDPDFELSIHELRFVLHPGSLESHVDYVEMLMQLPETVQTMRYLDKSGLIVRRMSSLYVDNKVKMI